MKAIQRLALCGGLSLSMFCLSAHAIEVDLGVRTGLNVHTGSFDAARSATHVAEGSTVNFGLGLAGGIGTEFHFTDMLSLETDLMWVTRGHVLTTTSGTTETNDRNGYNTLALPILLKFSFGTWDFIPYLGVGIEPYTIINAGKTHTETNKAATTSTIASSTYNPLNVGITGDLGFTYFWGDVGFNFDIRYTYTMTNVAAGGAATDTLRNQDIMTLVGAIFRL